MSDAAIQAALTLEDANAIAAAIEWRQAHFDEPFVMSVGVVVLNYGSKHTPIVCVGGEWSGVKSDLESTGGLPHCPNNHVLLETGPGKRLALVDDERVMP